MSSKCFAFTPPVWLLHCHVNCINCNWVLCKENRASMFKTGLNTFFPVSFRWYIKNKYRKMSCLEGNAKAYFPCSSQLGTSRIKTMLMTFLFCTEYLYSEFGQRLTPWFGVHLRKNIELKQGNVYISWSNTGRGLGERWLQSGWSLQKAAE